MAVDIYYCNVVISTGVFPIHYTDYTVHYDLDAYDMPMPEDMGHFRRNLEKRRFHTIAGLVPQSGVRRVLDTGTGSGWLSEILSKRGFNVHAVDLGLDSIKRASRRIKGKRKAQGHKGRKAHSNIEAGNVIHFTIGDIYRFPYRDGYFDAVVASEILEHLESPDEALREISRIIRPKGYLIVSTPYREKIEQTLCIHCNKKTPVNAHLHSFDENNIGELLMNCGFSLQRLMLFVNRPAERLGLAGMTCFVPHPVWRFFDAVLCGFLGRQTFMAVKATRNDR